MLRSAATSTSVSFPPQRPTLFVLTCFENPFLVCSTKTQLLQMPRIKESEYSRFTFWPSSRNSIQYRRFKLTIIIVFLVLVIYIFQSKRSEIYFSIRTTWYKTPWHRATMQINLGQLVRTKNRIRSMAKVINMADTAAGTIARYLNLAIFNYIRCQNTLLLCHTNYNY